MQKEQVDHLRELLEDFDTAMLVTHSNGHGAHARPMKIASVEQNCELWFFTGRDSGKVHEIQNDQEVLIVCQDEHKRYVSLRGVAEFTANRATARELWDDSYKVWFPKGVDDPDLLLIHVKPIEAEYWDTQGTKGLKYVFEAAKAYVKGKRPQIEEGEQHGHVVLE